MNIKKFLKGYEALESEQLKKELLSRLRLKLKLKPDICPGLEEENYSALKITLCLGSALYESKQFENSRILYELAYREAAKSTDKTSLGESLLMLGNICQKEKRFGSSISYLNEAIEVFRELDNRIKLAVCIAKVGIAESKLSNYEPALSLYLEAMKIMEELENYAWIGYLSNSIGVVFERLDDQNNAKKYYQKSLTTFQDHNYKSSIASPLNNLANLAFKEEQFEQALELHQGSMAIEEENKNYEGIFVSLNNIAVIYNKQNNIFEALKHSKKALDLKQKQNLSISSYMPYDILSEISIDANQLVEAEKYLELAEAELDENKDLKEMMEITEKRVKLAELKGDYKLAVEMQKKISELQKQLFEKNKVLQINEIHDKYMLELKEKEAQAFKQKNSELDLANSELEKVLKEKSEALNLLRESEEKYRNVVERAGEMIVIIQDNKVVFVNQVALKITGYEPRDLIGKGFMDLVTTNEKPKLKSRYQERMKGEAKLSIFSTFIIRKDGKKCFIEASGGLIQYKGKVADLVVIRDVSERVEAERLINQSKKKYKELYRMFRLMSDSIVDYIWAKDIEGNYTFVNKVLSEKLLFAPDTEEPVGKNIEYYEEKIHEQNSSKYWYTYGKITRDTDKQVIDTGKPLEYDERVYLKLRYHHFEIHKSPIFNDKGELVGVVGTARDITKQKQVEAALQENKERLELALLGSGAGLWHIYPQKGTMLINDRWAEMLDYKRSEIGSDMKNWRELVHPDDLEETDKILQEHIEGKTEIYQAEYRMRKKGGGWCWILSIGKVIEHDANGDAVRAAGTHIDITERKVQEEKLRTYQEHLKLINKMMRHDLANNFAVIHSGYRLFERTGDTKYLKDIDAKALNGVELIGSLKQIEDKFNDPDQLWLVDLIRRARHIAKGFSTLSFKFSGNAIVLGDEVIDSIIKNIFENSEKHGEATSIDIRTNKINNRIQLIITDNGKGLDPENLDNIFQESFTSGASGNTGLGLYLVRKSMARYSGSVEASLPPEHGLRLILSFPLLKTQK